MDRLTRPRCPVALAIASSSVRMILCRLALGVSAMVLGFVAKADEVFWNENWGILVSWGLGGAY